jgi:hypothetical protein
MRPSSPGRGLVGGLHVLCQGDRANRHWRRVGRAWSCRPKVVPTTCPVSRWWGAVTRRRRSVVSGCPKVRVSVNVLNAWRLGDVPYLGLGAELAFGFQQFAEDADRTLWGHRCRCARFLALGSAVMRVSRSMPSVTSGNGSFGDATPTSVCNRGTPHAPCRPLGTPASMLPNHWELG